MYHYQVDDEELGSVLIVVCRGVGKGLIFFSERRPLKTCLKVFFGKLLVVDLVANRNMYMARRTDLTEIKSIVE